MRGFIAAVHLCAALYICALMYRPAPVQARPVASWLKTDKIQDRLALTLPRCRSIRKSVQEFGIDAVIAEARRRGYSEAQINEAKNCLKEKT